MNEIKKIFLIKWDCDDADESKFLYLSELNKKFYESNFKNLLVLNLLGFDVFSIVDNGYYKELIEDISSQVINLIVQSKENLFAKRFVFLSCLVFKCVIFLLLFLRNDTINIDNFSFKKHGNFVCKEVYIIKYLIECYNRVWNKIQEKSRNKV